MSSAVIECKIKAPANPLEEYYWIAINGASCAASLNIPLSLGVQCQPTPQHLISFPTREEARDMQHFCLTGPIEEIHKRLMALGQREDVVIKVFKNPEQPTRVPTLWADGGMTKTPAPRHPMCPDHPKWEAFLDDLHGPQGCNFQLRRRDKKRPLTWHCDHGALCPLATRILAEMGLTAKEIEESLAYFRGQGGNCDCEIILNCQGV